MAGNGRSRGLTISGPSSASSAEPLNNRLLGRTTKPSRRLNDTDGPQSTVRQSSQEGMSRNQQNQRLSARRERFPRRRSRGLVDGETGDNTRRMLDVVRVTKEEVEEGEEERKQDVHNPEYTVHVKTFLGSKIHWTVRWGSYPSENYAFSMEDFEVALLDRLDELRPYEIVSKRVGIRSSTGHSDRLWQTWDELTSVEWNETAELAIRDLWHQTLKPVDVIIEIHMEGEKQTAQHRRSASISRLHMKRPRGFIESSDVDDEEASAPQEPPRKTRAIQSLASLTPQVDRREEVGDSIDAICRRWDCPDDSCRNFMGHCWIAEGWKHYAISAGDQNVWSLEIVQGRASVENPPAMMVARWVEASGPANFIVENRRQDFNSRMDRIMAIQAKQIEVMLDRELDSIERRQNQWLQDYHQQRQNQNQWPQ